MDSSQNMIIDEVDNKIEPVCDSTELSPEGSYQGDLGDFFPELYEETSYHELRSFSNDDDCNGHIMSYEYEDYVQEYDTYHNFRNFSDDCINDNLKNTDDQLSIEIVKEEIDLQPDAGEKSSIFDFVRFHIEDYEDPTTIIKIIDDNPRPIDQKKDFTRPQGYVIFKKPQDLPKRSKVVRLKEKRKAKKPIGLTNYSNLITDAINSSPEKRMILTDIYKWILNEVPFFRSDENSWKNCVRHTLSVNEKFMRVKNKMNHRLSYWAVCEEGEFNSKIAVLPWASEIYKPEERKRPKKKMDIKREQKEKPVKKKVSTTKVTKKRGSKSKPKSKKKIKKSARLRTPSKRKKVVTRTPRKVNVKKKVAATRVKKEPLASNEDSIRRSGRRKIAKKVWVL